LDVPSLQVLDAVKQKVMTAHAELQVDIQSAASRDNRVQGRLQVKKSK